MKQTILSNDNLLSDALQFITLNSVIKSAQSVNDFQFTQFKTVTFRQITPFILNDTKTPRRRSGMKPKVRARAAHLNAEPELFHFKANVTYLIKSKAQKYHILHNQH